MTDQEGVTPLLLRVVVASLLALVWTGAALALADRASVVLVVDVDFVVVDVDFAAVAVVPPGVGLMVPLPRATAGVLLVLAVVRLLVLKGPEEEDVLLAADPMALRIGLAVALVPGGSGGLVIFAPGEGPTVAMGNGKLVVLPGVGGSGGVVVVVLVTLVGANVVLEPGSMVYSMVGKKVGACVVVGMPPSRVDLALLLEDIIMFMFMFIMVLLLLLLLLICICPLLLLLLPDLVALLLLLGV